MGQHVRQGGSLVAPDRLRFDFTHPVGLSRSELEDVRSLVNGKIRSDLLVAKRELSYNQAIAEGALGFLRRQVRRCGEGGGDRRWGEVLASRCAGALM